MSRFISFIITDEGKVFFGNFRAHVGIVAANNFKIGEYREVDYIKENNRENIIIRQERNDSINRWFAIVKSLFPKWDDLFNSLKYGKILRHDVPPDFLPKIEEFEFCNINGLNKITGSLGTFYSLDMNGILHNIDAPAMEYIGYKEWWQNGKRHRIDGPAIEGLNGHCEWWENGKFKRRS